MAVSLQKFVQQLQESGLVDGDTLKEFLPPNASPATAEVLALALVRREKLTKFQATEVSRGRGKSLIFGNYVLIDKIGAGGMGQVFKARHRVMERLVAVKVLPGAMTKDQNALSRFLREVKAAAKLNHPNIVTAYDADQADGIHFLVMELVDGSDLSVLVKKNGAFPVNRAVNYVLQAAKGLEYAHKKGVVHRDIKPANLLLDKEGTVKILDMGLARIHEDTNQSELTGTGQVMGTVDYMAPEQAVSTKSADARADIYALGCSLHYLLAGKSTYDGETLMAKMIAHREHPIPKLSDVCPVVPKQLEDIFRKMVAKKVEDRYQSMTDLIADLDRLGTDHTTQFVHDERSIAPVEMTSNLRSAEVTSAYATIFNLPSMSAISAISRPDMKWTLMGAVALGMVILAGVVFWFHGGNRTPIAKEDRPSPTIPSKEEPVAKAKSKLAFATADFDQWVKTTAALPVDDQLEAVRKKLKELNPGFDGVISSPWNSSLPPIVNDGHVTELTISTDKIADLSPIRAFSELKNFGYSAYTKTYTSEQVFEHAPLDLSPFDGMKVTNLYFNRRQINLSTLKGLPLAGLTCMASAVTDLTPLSHALPLEGLTVSGNWGLKSLAPLKGMSLKYLACDNCQVTDFTPLTGMPLKSLVCEATQVTDLSPLKGMPLEELFCDKSPITDLTPLQGMKLKKLSFTPKQSLKGVQIIRDMESLVEIGVDFQQPFIPRNEFWKQYDEGAFREPEFQKWIKDVQALSPADQIAAVSKKLTELNPGFDGKLASPWSESAPALIRDDGSIYLKIYSDKIIELSPIRAFSNLQEFGYALRSRPADIAQTDERLDLSSLAGMNIGKFSAWGHQIDLSTVKDLPLSELSCIGCGITDLTPISGLPFESLGVSGNWNLKSLAPLKGMSLKSLSCDNCQIADFSPLMGMPLKWLVCEATQVTDLSPLKGMPLEELYCDKSPITDFSPLQGMKLKKLTFTLPPGLKGLQAIREMDSLVEIGVDFRQPLLPRKEFWKQFDAGAFK